MQEQAKVAACAAVTFALEAFLEAEVSVKLGREKGEARRRSGQERLMAWQCGHGGCREANQWTRDGHDQRDRSTGWGHLSGLPVPMLACQRCQPDVVSHFALMETYHRDGMDLDHQVLFGSGFGESWRPFQERWSATVEGRVGLRTLNERINQMEPLAKSAHPLPITPVPPVIPWDGIWVMIQSQQETIKPDTRQRPRKKRPGRTMVI